MADICQVIQQAIAMEQEAESFYRQAAEQATNPLATQTFEALAGWEAEHRRLLQSVFDSAQATRACPTLVDLRVERRQAIDVAAQIFQAALAELKGELAEDDSLDAAYAAAMEKERNAIRFYRKSLEEAESDPERELYEFLLEQERGHLNLLATTEEYLNDTAYWHFKQEQWIVTG